MKITRRMWGMAAGAVLALNLGLPAARAAEEAPDALVKRVSADVLETIKKDASLRNGDSSKINALVNEKVMPYVDFRRMTSAAVGPFAGLPSSFSCQLHCGRAIARQVREKRQRLFGRNRARRLQPLQAIQSANP